MGLCHNVFLISAGQVHRSWPTAARPSWSPRCPSQTAARSRAAVAETQEHWRLTSNPGTLQSLTINGLVEGKIWPESINVTMKHGELPVQIFIHWDGPMDQGSSRYLWWSVIFQGWTSINLPALSVWKARGTGIWLVLTHSFGNEHLNNPSKNRKFMGIMYGNSWLLELDGFGVCHHVPHFGQWGIQPASTNMAKLWEEKRGYYSFR